MIIFNTPALAVSYLNATSPCQLFDVNPNSLVQGTLFPAQLPPRGL